MCGANEKAPLAGGLPIYKVRNLLPDDPRPHRARMMKAHALFTKVGPRPASGWNVGHGIGDGVVSLHLANITAGVGSG